VALSKWSPRFWAKKFYSKLKYESGVHRVQRVLPPSRRARSLLRRDGRGAARADEIDIKIEAKIAHRYVLLIWPGGRR